MHAQCLGGRQAHVLVGLVDDQLLSLQLRQRDSAQHRGDLGDARLEPLERHRLVDQFDVRGLAAVSGSPVSECHFTLARLIRYSHIPVR